MKKLWKSGLLMHAAMMLFCASCAGAQPTLSEVKPAPEEGTAAAENGSGDSDDIVILFTNDVHCAIDNNIGYDGLKLYKTILEQDYDSVILADAGDAVQGGIYGTLSDGEAIIEIMNLVGYDVAALGNHEFDYGLDQLYELSQKLSCGYICANFCTADGETVYEPYRILEAEGKKIAFIGVDTPTSFTKTPIHTLIDDTGLPMYDFKNSEDGKRLYECVQENVDEVRKNGADYVILLAHLGDESSDPECYHSGVLIRNTTGVDAVIDGHSHDVYVKEKENLEGKPVPLLQTGTGLKAIGKLVIHPDGSMESELVQEVPVKEGIAYETKVRGEKERAVDPTVSQRIEEIRDTYASVLEEKIGTTDFELIISSAEDIDDRARTEAPLGDLIADAYCTLGGSEAAILNTGSIRNTISAGEISYNSVLSALPYSNDIVDVKIKGQDLKDALEFGARKLPEKNNGFLQVSGIQFTVDVSVPSVIQEDEYGVFTAMEGEYRVKDILINGEPLDTERYYYLSGSDFLFSGGDGMAMLKNAELIEYTGMTDNKIVSEYIKVNLGGVIPEKYKNPDGRITIINMPQD